MFFVFKFVVVLLLIVQGGKVYLPTPPSCPEVKIFLMLMTTGKDVMKRGKYSYLIKSWQGWGINIDLTMKKGDLSFLLLSH